jgi:hypothetical protein
VPTFSGGFSGSNLDGQRPQAPGTQPLPHPLIDLAPPPVTARLLRDSSGFSAGDLPSGARENGSRRRAASASPVSELLAALLASGEGSASRGGSPPTLIEAGRRSGRQPGSSSQQPAAAGGGAGERSVLPAGSGAGSGRAFESVAASLDPALCSTPAATAGAAGALVGVPHPRVAAQEPSQDSLDLAGVQAGTVAPAGAAPGGALLPARDAIGGVGASGPASGHGPGWTAWLDSFMGSALLSGGRVSTGDEAPLAAKPAAALAAAAAHFSAALPSRDSAGAGARGPELLLSPSPSLTTGDEQALLAAAGVAVSPSSLLLLRTVASAASARNALAFMDPGLASGQTALPASAATSKLVRAARY